MSEMHLIQTGFDITKNPKYDGCSCGFVSVVYKCFDKKSSGGAVTRLRSDTPARGNKSAIISEILPSQQSALQLHQTIIRKIIWKYKVYSSVNANIWSGYPVDLQLISKYNKGFQFFYVLLILSINMYVLLIWKTKKILQLIILFKNF